MSTPAPTRANAAYLEAMYQRYLADPSAVPDDWRLFFAGFEFAGAAPGTAGGGGVFGLVTAYREFGHLIAHLDPLSEPPATHPLLELANVGLAAADLDADVDPRPYRGPFRGTLEELVGRLRDTYCGTVGFEFMDIPDKSRRDWMEERIEARRDDPPLTAPERIAILERLIMADAFEQFLQVKYVGQKRFSLEGAAALVPMLDALIESAAGFGVEHIVIGMAHRGRLNVLANIMGKPLERLLAEFEARVTPEEMSDQGDVKYHLGYASRRETRSGREMSLDLQYNPSHLEFVDPVVLGSVRARQALAGDAAREHSWPVLVHGEASFVGEGIVPETLILSQLPGFDVGGTVHVIVNNQVGFTTSPEESRPTRYPTDISRVIEAPVLHVNGDDPEAAVRAIRMACAYRAAFRRDVFVDLVCYRKHGHNELDDPTFTQPLMYREIAKRPTLSSAYAEKLIAEGVVDAATVRAMEAEYAQQLNAAHRRAHGPLSPDPSRALAGAWEGLRPAGDDWTARTAVSRATLEQVMRSAAAVPPEFQAHPKAAKLIAERVTRLAEDRVDWGAGEVLALGTLLLEGYHVRLCGQDAGRGTFSHRHAILHDQQTGATHVPLRHLAPGQGRIEIINSPLSEAGVLGFEYGYSTADPHTLVLWEAQFGDFANVAQVAIDQFIASSEAKWGLMSGIVLLLPHGYEGQGPEHSSARLERVLELCAKGNMQVCNLTTPAQLFHALRRQMHRSFRKPLVIMSPKSGLRHRLAVSPAAAFTSEGFHTVLDDPEAGDRSAIERVLVTSGRLFYALLDSRRERPDTRTAIVRVEQIYPFPRTELVELFAHYPNAREIRWVQEEPANMGAWRHIRHRLENVLPQGTTLAMIARKAVPAPATGYYPIHVEEEKRILDRAFDPAPSPVRVTTVAPVERRS